MRIFKLKIKSSEHNVVEKVVPATDIPNAIQTFMDKVATHSVTNITITPLGEMPDNYVEGKYHEKEPKVVRPRKPVVEDLPF